MCQVEPRSASARLAAAIVLVAGVAWPDVGEACSQTLPALELVGFPAEQETDVPTDAVFVYDSVHGNVSGKDTFDGFTFTLRSAAGTAVGIAPSPNRGTSFELIPEAELEPNTTYTLEVTLADSSRGLLADTVTFSTGAGRALPAPALSGAFLQRYHMPDAGKVGCGPNENGTCVAFPPKTIVGFTFADALGQDADPFAEYIDLWQHSSFTNLSVDGHHHPFPCLNLRPRSANGVLGDPVTLCGTDITPLELEASQISCTSKGIEGAELADEGCSVVAGAAHRRSFAWAGVGLALLGFIARKRVGQRVGCRAGVRA